jgi:hypothetical protein
MLDRACASERAAHGWTEHGPRRPLGRRERTPLFDLPFVPDRRRNGTIVPLDEVYAEACTL